MWLEAAKARLLLTYILCCSQEFTLRQDAPGAGLACGMRFLKLRDLAFTLQGQSNVVQAFYQAMTAEIIYLEEC